MSSKKVKFPESLTTRFANAKYLNSGAEGSVFKVQDLILQKDVAIKILPESASEAQVIRFQQEAKATSKLNHPNIVQIYNFDVNDSGTVFMVIELIEGETLKSFIAKKNHIDIKFSISLFQQICLGMKHAHDNNILHRDLKPGNILLSQDEESNYILKIIDFGIAKVLDVGVELTTGNIAIGTPAYMSPEQGAGKDVDGRSDIYAFGCIMYEFLVGEKPYIADTPMEVIYKHAMEDLPLFEKTFEEEEIPQRLQEVISKCLEKDRDLRYESFLEVFNALEEISYELESESRPLEEQEPKLSESGWTLNPALILVPVIVGVFISTLAVPEFVKHNKPKAKEPPREKISYSTEELKPPSIPEIPEFYSEQSDTKLLITAKDYRKKREFALAISFLNELLRRYPDKPELYELLGKNYMEFGYTNKAQEYLAILKSKNKTGISYLRLRAFISYEQGKYDQALREYTSILESYPQDLESREYRMEIFYSKEDYENTIVDAVVLLEKNRNSFHIRKTRAKCYNKLQQYKMAIVDYTRLINATKPKEKELRANLLSLRADSFYSLGSYKEALRDSDEAIKLGPKDKKKVLKIQRESKEKIEKKI